MYASLGEALNEIAAQIKGKIPQKSKIYINTTYTRKKQNRKVILTSYVLDRGKNSCNCYIFLREGKIYPIYLYNMIQ